MAEGSKRRRAVVLAAAAAACLGVAGWVATSASLRASLSAAYRAFRDPALIAGSAPSCPTGPSWPGGTGEGEPQDFITVEPPALQVDGGAAARVTMTLSDLPIPVTQKTMEFVRYFAQDPTGRKLFEDRFRRAGRYRAHIERALREAGVPEDMLWLSAALSGFSPQATSAEGAVGLFQFTPQAAARFGLAQDEYIDERRSITRGTAAATAYLSDLYERYGSWDVALAAYHLGQERMDEAVEKWRATQKPGKEGAPPPLTELAERGLVPRATMNFVAQVHAFGLVAANRSLLKLDDLDPAPPLELSEIAVPQGTRLKTIAAAAGISVATLRDYNPELLKDRLPLTGGDVLVNLPADRVDRALAAFPAYLAREAAETEATSEAEPAASAAPGAKPKAPAPAAGPGSPPRERWIVDDGVAVERVAATSDEVELVARVDILEPTRTGWRETGERFAAGEVKTAPPALDRGVAQAIERLNALVAGGGGPDLALRRRIALARRPILEGIPYGSSWIALSEALFPQGHPHEGAVLSGLLQPAADLLFSEHEPRLGARITLAVHGPAEREAIDRALARALGSYTFGAGAPFGAHPREDRRKLTASVAYTRFLVGWIAPPRGGQGEGAVRLALAVLVHSKIGRAQRALILDRRLAARVRGVLELGRRGSVAAIEVVPAVPHDVAEVQAALDGVIEALGRDGPTPEELGAAKAVLKAGQDKERMLAASARTLKELRVREVDRTLAAIEAATADDVRNAVTEVLSRDHRVLVVTEPRR